MLSAKFLGSNVFEKNGNKFKSKEDNGAKCGPRDERELHHTGR